MNLGHYIHEFITRNPLHMGALYGATAEPQTRARNAALFASAVLGGQYLTGTGEGAGAGTGGGSPTWMNYLNQGSNLFGGMGGPGGVPMPPPDNSMILPAPEQQDASSMPPGLMTMLLASAFQRQQQPQALEGPTIRAGGVI